jgi:hypothetical protein
MEWHDENWHSAVEVKDGEIDVIPGKFYEMSKAGLFAKEYYDENDSLKRIGIAEDGKVYVTQKDLSLLTDDEWVEYMKRRPITKEDELKLISLEEALADEKNARFII